MKPRSNKIISVKESFTHITLLENRINRLSPQSNLNEKARNYIDYINICNSFSIAFIRYDMKQEALELLVKAMKTDVRYQWGGEVKEKLWSGRLITVNNLAFILMRYFVNLG